MADVDVALAELGPSTVVGRGLGAYIALLIAGARPQLVRGAVLCDGPGLFGGGVGPTSATVLTVDRRGRPHAGPVGPGRAVPRRPPARLRHVVRPRRPPAVAAWRGRSWCAPGGGRRGWRRWRPSPACSTWTSTKRSGTSATRAERRCAPLSARARPRAWASSLSPARASGVTGAAASAATAVSTSTVIRPSSWCTAPVSSSTCWMAATSARPRSARPTLGQHPALAGVGARRGQRQEGRGLALAEVVTDRLAGHRLVAEGAEHVVAELEGVAEGQAVGRQRRQQLAARAGAARRAPRCSGRSTVYLPDL